MEKFLLGVFIFTTCTVICTIMVAFSALAYGLSLIVGKAVDKVKGVG
jgi:cytochrome oxidase Cu insertion factor (SCO1/SenC/PrrC family)